MRAALEKWDQNACLSEFQHCTERDLKSVLASRGSRLDGYALEGQSECYIRARLAGTSLVVLVYADGAEIRSGDGTDLTRVDDRFEKPDFPSLTALRQAFLERVGVLLAERGLGASEDPNL